METYWGKNGTRTRVIENILKPDGNRVSAQVDYAYDNLYRLTHEHRIAYNGGNAGVTYEYNFVYDGAGNRTKWQVVGGSTTNYSYDAANKMTSPGTFTYDDKGNTSTIASGGVTTTYTWDLLNRMTQWAKTGQTTIDFVYNADGMRVRKTPSGGTATNFLLDAREIAEEITGSTATAYVGPGLVSKIAGTTRAIYHNDAIGSTRVVSDGNQGISEAAVYSAYGNLEAEYGTSSTPGFGFAGQYRYYADSTGLDYLKARYYDPATGRFVSRDPIGYEGGMNLYAYAYDNPVMGVDPNGNLSIGGIIGGIGGWIGRIGIGIGGWFGICGIAGAMEGFVSGATYPKGDPNADKVAHCVAACRIRRCGTVVQSWLWGYIKEYFDVVWHWDTSAFSYDDLMANGVGESCAKENGTCEDNCKKRYPPRCK